MEKNAVRTNPSGQPVSSESGTPINPSARDIVSHEDDQVAKKIEEALGNYFPAESKNGKTKLHIEDTYVDRKNDDAKKPGKLSELRQSDRSYSLPVRSRVRLEHDGKVIDEREKKVGDHYPIIPGLNTRLIDGNLYQNKFQVRRRPGAYPYRADSGQDRIEFNTKGKTDFQFVVDGDKTDTSTLDLFMTGDRQNIERGGYAMMRALGYSDEDLKEKWGEDIWRQNAFELDEYGNPQEKLSKEDLKKLVDRSHNALSGRDEKKKSDSFSGAQKELKKQFSDMNDAFDRDVNRQTLGVPSGGVNEDLVDSALDQLVKQHTGQKKPPHRFNEKFRTLHGMPDQIKKGLEHWRFANKINPNLKRALNEVEEKGGLVQRDGEKRQPTVSDVTDRAMNKIRDKVRKKYKNSDLSATTETNNILDIEGRSKEVTIGGEGGINNDHAITPETISLHPSRLGLMDIVKTQVSNPGKTVPMASGATISKDDEIKRMAYDRKLGKVRSVSTEEIDEEGLAFPDEFERKEEDGSVKFEPKSDEVQAAMGDEVRPVSEEDVRYVLTDETHMFSDNTNIVPFLNHDSGPRAIMGANQMTQGLSLQDPEKPLVDTVDEKGETFSKRIGERYNAKAPAEGTVKSVEEDRVTVEDEDGKAHTVPILRDFPFNQGGFIDQNPVVEEGDSVSEGDLLTKNNYTDEEGNLAIGKNLRTAYIPYDGWNYEDAIVMSESGADKLTSESIKEKTLEYGKEDIKNPKALKAFHTDSEKALSPKNEDKLDEDGVIKEGETIEPGEVLATAVRPVDMEEGSQEHAKKVRSILGEEMKRRDASLKYKGSHPGKVIKTKKDGNKVKAFIKTEEPFREGDKLCYTPDHEVLTERGWVPFPELKKEDKVCTLNPETNEIEYDRPSRVTEFDHDDRLYHLETQQLSFRVTPGHQMFVNPRNPAVDGETFAGHRLMKAKEIEGKRVKYKTDGNWSGVSRETLTLPALDKEEGRGNNNQFLQSAYTETEVPANSLLYLLGMYLAEGSTTEGNGGNYSVSISQERGGPGYDPTVNALRKMGLNPHEKEDRIVVHDKQLWSYLRDEVPGHADQKRIPRWALRLSTENLQHLFDGLVDGDGYRGETNYVYTTTSKGLADDVHELVLKLGMAGRITEEDPKTENIKGTNYDCARKWRVHIRTNRLEPTVNHGHQKDQNGQTEKWEDYDGKVYCCTVPNHILYVRRNGKAAWCGNTGRHGEKGIVSKILPDEEMLQDKDGNPMDILLDPHGVPSRANPGQVMELAAGKIADKTGEQYKVKNFTPDMLDQIKKDLDKHNLSDKETLVDPKTGREIEDVATGKAYKAKLKHKLDKKFKARKFFDSDEGGYDLDEQPVDGASMDNLTLHAMIGHNARANLSEMSRIKGTRNSDYWKAMANNEPLPDVQDSPYSFKKMKAMIQGLGVNVEDQDAQNELKLSPMTDEDIERHSGGEVTDPGGMEVTQNTTKAMDSSIFDPNVTGENGRNWNHIELGEKVPNPLFDKAIGLMLQNGAGTKDDEEVRIVKEEGSKGKTMRSGFNFKDVENVYTGKSKIQIGDNQYTGPEALEKALGTVDIDKTVSEMEDRLKNEFEKVEKGEKQPDGTKVTNLHMGMKYAKGLQEKDMRPEEGYMMSKAPVMPLKFRRPMVNQETGKIMTPSVNHLYRSVIAGSNKVQQDHEFGKDDEMMQDSRQELYDSFGALVGASGKRPQGDYSATGIMDQLASPRSLSGEKEYGGEDTDSQGPKGGYAQSKVVKKKMEGSGRSTIIPDPDLSVDKVGLPEEMAWRMYEPYTRRRMTRNSSMTPEEAKKEYKKRSSEAKRHLKDEMKDRPVMLNRDPSWWKYNVMGFEPELRESDPENPIAEKAIRVPNLVVNSYFGGDFDGDTMSAHVPTEREAVEEAKRMKPSNHLKAPGSYNLMINPNQSMLMGMNLMSEQGEVSEGQDAKKTTGPISEYERGKMNLGDTVEYEGKKQPAGWAMIDQAVKRGSNDDLRLDDVLQDIKEEQAKQGKDEDVSRETLRLNKWGLEDKWLSTLVEKHPDKYAPIMNEMSRVGNLVARNEGFTVGVSDMKTLQGKADKLSEEADKMVPELSEEIARDKYGLNERTKDTDDEARIRLYGSSRPFNVGDKEVTSVTQKILDEIDSSSEDDNSFFKMQKVGSKGNRKQIQQVLGSYGLVDDVRGQTVPNPIKNSLSEGLTASEYYTQQHGAIAGLRDRSVETSKPGDIGKQIVAGSSTLLVTEKDCGTRRGEELPVEREPFGGGTAKPNRDLIDRVLAEGVEGTSLVRGDVVDGDAFAEIQSSDVEEVKVRSPLQCEAKEGVCQQCFGKDETGSFPEIGDNVGIEEGQSIVEASTRLTLKSFHTGGASDESLGGFDDFEEVVHLQTPRNKASIAKFKGPIDRTAEVKDINERTGPNGEVSSYIASFEDKESGDKKNMRIPGHRTLEISEGDKVKNGQKLTKGRRDPNELINLGEGNEGVQEVQQDTTDNLHGIFEDIGGIGRRTAETVVSAMSGFGRVTDPGDSEFTLGDEGKVAKMRAFNSKGPESIPIDEADGRVLAEDVEAGGMTYNEGQELKPMVISSIKSSKGPDFEVEVQRNPVKFNQEVKSVLNLPRSGDDWLPKMNYRKIKQEMRRSGIRGDESPIRGSHPVSAYMYGKGFDKGNQENRWKY